MGRAARHLAANYNIWKALMKADVPSSKEQPDGGTLGIIGRVNFRG